MRLMFKQTKNEGNIGYYYVIVIVIVIIVSMVIRTVVIVVSVVASGTVRGPISWDVSTRSPFRSSRADRCLSWPSGSSVCSRPRHS